MPTGIGTGLLLSSIIGGGASILGGALGDKSSQQTSGSSSQSNTSTSAPTYDPKYGPLQNQILQMVQSRLTSDPNLTGYTAQGVQGINRGFALQKGTQNANLTARGLAGSPIAGVVDAMRENARGGAVTTFQNQIPLLARDLQNQDLSLASGVLGQGRGTTSTSSSTGTSTGTGAQTSGGGAAGAFDNLAQYLGYLQGKGTFGNFLDPNRTAGAKLVGPGGVTSTVGSSPSAAPWGNVQF